jgi:hypothetical protein
VGGASEGLTGCHGRLANTSSREGGRELSEGDGKLSVLTQTDHSSIERFLEVIVFIISVELDTAVPYLLTAPGVPALGGGGAGLRQEEVRVSCLHPNLHTQAGGEGLARE